MENRVGGSTPAPGGASKRCISAHQTFFFFFVSQICNLFLFYLRVRAKRTLLTHLFMLHEVDKSRPLHLHGLPVPVVERQDEVEKVGLAEIGGRLLLKVSPRQGDPAGDTTGRGSSSESLKTSYRVIREIRNHFRNPLHSVYNNFLVIC